MSFISCLWKNKIRLKIKIKDKNEGEFSLCDQIRSTIVIIGFLARFVRKQRTGEAIEKSGDGNAKNRTGFYFKMASFKMRKNRKIIIDGISEQIIKFYIYFFVLYFFYFCNSSSSFFIFTIFSFFTRYFYLPENLLFCFFLILSFSILLFSYIYLFFWAVFFSRKLKQKYSRTETWEERKEGKQNKSKNLFSQFFSFF